MDHSQDAVLDEMQRHYPELVDGEVRYALKTLLPLRGSGTDFQKALCFQAGVAHVLDYCAWRRRAFRTPPTS